MPVVPYWRYEVIDKKFKKDLKIVKNELFIEIFGHAAYKIKALGDLYHFCFYLFVRCLHSFVQIGIEMT